jgi:hypothetical protein
MNIFRILEHSLNMEFLNLNILKNWTFYIWTYFEFEQFLNSTKFRIWTILKFNFFSNLNFFEFEQEGKEK